jgi:CDP-diacylglycerol--serine O-phosphatidyltransferase
MTGRFSQFGVQLDSIADIIGFGVAPAMIAWAWILQDLGVMGVAITFWYILATSFRLARFNVDSDEDAWPLKGHSQGLTSTMAGGCLVTLVWVSNGYLAESIYVPSWAFGSFVAMLGLLMVTSVPFRTFRNLRASKAARRWMGFALSCCLAGAVFLDPSMWWGVGAALYLVLGLGDGLVVAAHRRLLSRALLLDEFDEVIDEMDQGGVDLSDDATVDFAVHD